MKIQCQDISKIYRGDGVQVEALKEIDCVISENEIAAIVGPSGSGKSTLLSILGTLDLPTNGTLTFDENTINRKNKKQLADFRFQHIGFVFQDFHLIPSMTALENVMAPLLNRRVSFNKKEKAETLLKQVGLEDKMYSLPAQLSGGQKQRVAIARALVGNPSWILADEPTGSLDTVTGQSIIDLLKEVNMKRNTGIIIVTHERNIADQADRVIKMENGKIVDDYYKIN
jgi:ABC-type lipoprotein export system ATPase subunit